MFRRADLLTAEVTSDESENVTGMGCGSYRWEGGRANSGSSSLDEVVDESLLDATCSLFLGLRAMTLRPA